MTVTNVLFALWVARLVQCVIYQVEILPEFQIIIPLVIYYCLTKWTELEDEMPNDETILTEVIESDVGQDIQDRKTGFIRSQLGTDANDETPKYDHDSTPKTMSELKYHQGDLESIDNSEQIHVSSNYPDFEKFTSASNLTPKATNKNENITNKSQELVTIDSTTKSSRSAGIEKWRSEKQQIVSEINRFFKELDNLNIATPTPAL